MNSIQLFSFHAISDEEFSSVLSGINANKNLLENCSSKFKLLSSYEYKFNDFENYVDLDNNLETRKRFFIMHLFVEVYFSIFIK